MTFNCTICNKNYKNNSSLWKHNKKFHSEDTIKDTNEKSDFKCKYCGKEYSNRNSKYKHQVGCKDKSINFENQINELKKQIEEIKNKPTSINNNYINKGTINFFNKPGLEDPSLLTEKEVEYILDEELNSVIKVIEYLNFNDKMPENHTFCSTSLNDKHISVMNTETLIVEKKLKNEFIEQLILPGINKVKILYNKINGKHPKKTVYKKRIDELVNYLIINNKGRKVFVEAVNLLTYNNRHKIMTTWEQISGKNIDSVEFDIDNEEELVQDNKSNDNYCNKGKINNTVNSKATNPTNTNSLLNFDKDSSSEYSEQSDLGSSQEYNDSDSELEENEPLKIEYKGIIYLMKNNLLYLSKNNISQGISVGKLVNGRVRLDKPKDIDV